MKNCIKPIIFIWIVGLFFTACKKEELENFRGKDVAYFELAQKRDLYINGTSFYRTDSLSFTFAWEGAKVIDTILKIPIKIQGYTASTARAVTLSIMKESTAKEGVDFKIPKKIEILPDSVRTYIPIHIYRTPEMKKKRFSIDLKLLPNKNFRTNLTGETKRSGDHKIIKYNQFKLVVSDILSAPPYWAWSGGASYLGSFSVKKLKILAKLTGVKLSFYKNEQYTSVFKYNARLLKLYLVKKRKEGHPVLEEDGTPMAVSPYL